MNAFERVKRWRQEAAGNPDHWMDDIPPEAAEEIARRLDEPMSLDSAPRDGSLFDVQQDGIPYLDCRFDSYGRLVQIHGYPSSTRVFDIRSGNFAWTPRPADRVQPYANNAAGRKYIP